MQNSHITYFSRIFILFLFFIPILYAPLYDFGTMQQGNSATTYPGGNASFNLYFFVDEKYGDRITHVRILASEFPDDWVVTIDPPLHLIRLNISGVITNGEENLYIEPRPVLSQIPEKPEPGTNYLFSPSGLGYLQAKELKVNVRIPENAELGKTYHIKIDADARWYESSGQIALVQSRTFRYDIRVISQYYTEEILPLEEPNETVTETIVEPPKEKPFDINFILIGIMALVILLLLAYILLSRRKNHRSN